MRYGVISYVTPGRVFPRSRLRENPFPVRRKYRVYVRSGNPYPGQYPGPLTGDLCVSPTVTGTLTVCPIITGTYTITPVA